MDRHTIRTWCLALAIAPAIACADTLVLKDGTSLDGTVTKINDHCMSIRSGHGEIIYQTDEVTSIEKNDKKGTHDFATYNPAAARHEQFLFEKTGLHQDQREMLIKLVDRLALEDTTARNQAIKDLIALQRQLDVYRFLHESRQGFGTRVLPGVLEVMLALNATETKAIILEYLVDKTPENRIAALRVAAAHKEIATVDTLARGVIDTNGDVQIEAIHALAERGDKRATPVLLTALGNANPRIHNASEAALAMIWSKPEAPVAYESANEWTKFWNESSKNVIKPIEMASLQPLSVLPEGSYVFAHE